MFNQKSIHDDSLVGKVFLKKYTLQKKLGEGSFGMIYKATSEEGEFALKFEAIESKREYGNLGFKTDEQKIYSRRIL